MQYVKNYNMIAIRLNTNIKNRIIDLGIHMYEYTSIWSKTYKRISCFILLQ